MLTPLSARLRQSLPSVPGRSSIWTVNSRVVGIKSPPLFSGAHEQLLTTPKQENATPADRCFQLRLLCIVADFPQSRVAPYGCEVGSPWPGGTGLDGGGEGTGVGG